MIRKEMLEYLESNRIIIPNPNAYTDADLALLVKETEQKTCIHKRFKIVREEYYIVEQGYEKFIEGKDTDLGAHFVEEKEVRCVCEECGKELE